MKICPVCHIEYSDEADYCAKCHARLEEKSETGRDVPFNGRALAKSVIWTCVFIAVIAGLYWLYSLIANP